MSPSPQKDLLYWEYRVKRNREMKLRKTSTKTEKWTIWALIEAQREKEGILEEKRQRHLDTPSRSQWSP